MGWAPESKRQLMKNAVWAHDQPISRGSLRYAVQKYCPCAPCFFDGILSCSNSLQQQVDSVHQYPYAFVIEKRNEPVEEFSAVRKGTIWNPFFSLANPIDVTQAHLLFLAGSFDAVASPGIAEYDDAVAD